MLLEVIIGYYLPNKQNAMSEKKYTKLEDIIVYQRAMEIGEKVNTIIEEWDWFKTKTIGTQWVHSTDSIAANIAEGVGRYFYKEKLVFMYYSRGSLLESKTWLQKSFNRKWITEKEYKEIMDDLKGCHYLLNQYIKSIRKVK